MRDVQIYDQAFDERKVRKAVAAYFGMVSFLDHNIGKLLDVLRETGLAADTRVIYTSDHGDNLGARGLWGKSDMYEDSAGVPLIMAGPEFRPAWSCASRFRWSMRSPPSWTVPASRPIRRSATCRARHCSTSSPAPGHTACSVNTTPWARQPVPS